MPNKTKLENLEWAFSLNDTDKGIHRKLADGVFTRIFPGENVMLSVVTVEPNTSGIMHSHPEEQWGVLLEGDCVRLQGGEEVQMHKGDFWCTPGGVEHSVRAGVNGATILDIFSPPRAEYRRTGEGFASD